MKGSYIEEDLLDDSPDYAPIEKTEKMSILKDSVSSERENFRYETC